MKKRLALGVIAITLMIVFLLYYFKPFEVVNSELDTSQNVEVKISPSRGFYLQRNTIGPVFVFIGLKTQNTRSFFK